MTTDLALVEQSASIDVGRWAETLVFAAQLADKVADTEFVPAALRGRPEAVAATIMYGAEVGVTPMQALAGIHIVDGRPAPSAELMRAMILRAGHTFVIHEMSGTRVRVSGLRRGRPEVERVVVEWTLDMARAAGLLGRRNWQNYPRAMLIARATGDLARLLFADVVKGLGYVAEDASVDDLAVLSQETPESRPDAPRRPLQRRQRRAAPVVAEDPSDAQTAPADERPDVAPPLPVDGPAVASPKPAGVDRGEQSTSAGEGVHRPDDDGPRYEPPAVTPAVIGAGIAQTEYADDQALPELQPESPEPEQPAPGFGPPKVAAGPLKAIHVGLSRELGTVATREEKHELVGAIVGHPIESTKDLTRNEAYTVLDYLQRFATGEAAWQLDIGTGGVTITDLRTPPPEDGERSA